MSRLNERQRRLLAALESERYGRGGDSYISTVTGLDRKTIRRGRQELTRQIEEAPLDRVRHVGGGAWPIEKKADA